jgi:tryptophan-rich sensory protein
MISESAGWYAALRKPSWTPPAWVFGPAGALLVPYTLWVTFASTLNVAIRRLNR